MKQIKILLAILLTIFTSIFAGYTRSVLFAEENSNNFFVLTEEEKAYLKTIENDSILFGRTSLIQYFQNDDNQNNGLLEPLFSVLENEWNLNFQTVDLAWKELFEKLDNQEIDLAGLAYLMDSDVERYYHTNNLFNSQINIYTLKESYFDSVTELSNKKIGILMNTAIPEVLAVYVSELEYVKHYDSVDSLILALETKEIDCIATSISIQAELLTHSNVVFATRVGQFNSTQRLFSNNPKYEKLIDLINRYIDSDQGKETIKEINEKLRESVYEVYRDFYQEEISELQMNYKQFDIADGAVLYPVSFIKNKERMGLQKDILDILSELTSIDVVYHSFAELKGFDNSVEMIRDESIVALAGTNRSRVYIKDDELDYSVSIFGDNMSFYVREDEKRTDLKELKIGTSVVGYTFIAWREAIGVEPIVYQSRDELISALKSGEIDAIFINDTTIDYYYSVLGDYSVKLLEHSKVPSTIHFLLKTENESFKTILNSVINLYFMIDSEKNNKWTSLVQSDKFDYMRLKEELEVTNNSLFAIALQFGAVMIVVLIVVGYNLNKFRQYDKQITKMLTAQKNADMVWIDFATNRVTSKGNNPFKKKIEGNADAIRELETVDGYFESVQKMRRTRLAYNEEDLEFDDPNNLGDKIYIRRFVHEISSTKYMSFQLDITDQKYRESQLRELANKDDLTKLKNRRSMNKALDQILQNKREDYNVYVFMFDIDFFKQINDNYGHDIGDEVLRSLASIILSNFDHEGSSRWGGEEFLCAKACKDYAEAIALGNKVLKEFEAVETKVGDRHIINATVSCGATEYELGEDITETIIRADKAMYQSKHAGKNRVTYFSKAEYEKTPEFNESKNLEIYPHASRSGYYSRIMGQLANTLFHASDADFVIDEMLKITTIFTGLDCGYAVEKISDDRYRVIHAYNRLDHDNKVEVSQEVTITKEFIEINFKKDIPSFVSGFDKDANRKFNTFLSKNIQSGVYCPIFEEDNFVGYFAFISETEGHSWSTDEKYFFTDLNMMLKETIKRKHSEKSISVANETLKRVLENMTDLVYVIDAETKEIIFTNKATRDTFGAVFPGMKCCELVVPEHGYICKGCVHKQFENDNSDEKADFVRHEMYNPSVKRWFDIMNTQIEWIENRIAYLVLARDITDMHERNNKQLALLEELEYNKFMFDFTLKASKSYSWLQDPKFGIITFGETVVDTLGYTSDELSGYVDDFIKLSEGYQETLKKEMQEKMSSQLDEFTFEHPIRHKNGEIKWIVSRGKYVADQDMIFGVSMDVTETKDYEIYLKQLEKEEGKN